MSDRLLVSGRVAVLRQAAPCRAVGSLYPLERTDMSIWRRTSEICSACIEDIEQGGRGDGGHACTCTFEKVSR